MIPVQTALAPDFSQIPVVPVKQADGSTVNEYQFEAYIASGRYYEGAKQWDVRAWQSFTPDQYTPFVVAPTQSTVSLPLTPVTIPMDPADLCTADQEAKLAAEIASDIGQGSAVAAVPYGSKASANWSTDPQDVRRYWVLRLPGLDDIPFGALLQKRMANGVDPNGWGAPGHWTLLAAGPAFVFDPPSAPVAKPTDWSPARKLLVSEVPLLMHTLEGDFMQEPADVTVGRGDFTPDDGARLIHVEQMLEKLTGGQ